MFRLDEAGFLFSVLAFEGGLIAKEPGLGGAISGGVEVSLTCPSERRDMAVDVVIVGSDGRQHRSNLFHTWTCLYRK